jgi:DNA repair protein SbcD/Mre11
LKILHTSDWHVGKSLKGQSRLEDQIAALASIVKIATTTRPDLVIVAGDLYDTASPSPDATKVVTRALSALRATGAQVVVIAGNHDSGPAMDALRPWAEAAGVTMRGTPRSVADLTLGGRTAEGEVWRLAALPFVSQRFAIRATELFELTTPEANQTYTDHIARLVARLTSQFDQPDPQTGQPCVNLVAAHLAVLGARTGGGERQAHTVLAYSVPATVFPTTAHYVALGHLHRAQAVSGPCPIRYSGGPLAVDFGEADTTNSVTLVEVTAQTAPRVTQVEVGAGTPLRTVRGTLAQLAALPPSDAWLRVFISEPARPGLREEVQALLPKALEVRIDPALVPKAGRRDRSGPDQVSKSPRELFSDYLTSRNQDQRETMELFDRLHGEVLHSS